jgi:hypothetical protein
MPVDQKTSKSSFYTKKSVQKTEKSGTRKYQQERTMSGNQIANTTTKKEEQYLLLYQKLF